MNYCNNFENNNYINFYKLNLPMHDFWFISCCRHVYVRMYFSCIYALFAANQLLLALFIAIALTYSYVTLPAYHAYMLCCSAHKV